MDEPRFWLASFAEEPEASVEADTMNYVTPVNTDGRRDGTIMDNDTFPRE